jgi:hypothetical protein
MSSFVHGLYGAHLSKPARRRLVNWSRFMTPVAAGAGHALRLSQRLAVNAPGVAGAGLVSYGAWLAWAPAGFVVAGVFLLALDRRTAS